MGRVLTTNVAVERPDGTVVWYGPAYGNEADVAADDAKLIGDHCYAEPDEPTSVEDQAADDGDTPARRRRSRSKSED